MSRSTGFVEIYDSTLRDGAQARGISYSVEDKILIARKLDELGVQYIEGGWPNRTNPGDMEFFVRARNESWKNAKIAAFGSTHRAGASAEQDSNLRFLLDAETEVVTIFGKSWDLHVRDVLKCDLDENLRIIESSVKYLLKHGRRVIYDAEHFFDGCSADPEYALKTIRVAEQAGAEMVVLCDTNGGRLVSEVQRMVEQAKGALSIPFGIHAHNDSGMAVANSIVAVEAGAKQVQGVMNGFGERCGNANLCTIIPTLELKLRRECIGRDRLETLTEVSRFVAELANINHDHRQPYVGESAFAHKGGAHIDAMMKNPHAYEHVDPASVGNARQYLLSQQAGSSAVVHKLERLLPGVDKRDSRVVSLLEKVKRMEFEGYSFEAADASFELLAMRGLKLYTDPFEVVSWRTINRFAANGVADATASGASALESEAIVKVRVRGEIRHTVANGHGPVDALSQALRKALETDFPELADVRLHDYKVRDLSSRAGTAAKVRVLIQSLDHQTGESWGTVGVSENILEASWEALVDSLCYKLMRDRPTRDDGSPLSAGAEPPAPQG